MGPRKMIALHQDMDEVRFDNILTLCELSTSKFVTEEKADTVALAEMGPMLLKLAELLGTYQDQVSRISSISPLYDCKSGVRANGYRSFVRIAGAFVSLLTEKLVSIGAKGARNIDGKNVLEISNLTSCLDKLVEINRFILEIHAHSEHSHNLFPADPDIKRNGMEELSLKIAQLDYSIFYGETVGFHYRGDCRRLAQPLLFAYASFGDIFDGSWMSKLRKLARAMFGIRYTLNPGLVARKVFEEVKEQPVEFCKTFYGLSEMGILHRNQFYVKDREPQIKANCVIIIPPEKTRIMNTQGAAFQVPIPSSHLGPNRSVSVRLISPFRTPDMIGSCPCSLKWPSQNCSCQIVPTSESVIFHLHGGGFVSQTSKSHVHYLRSWAKDLGIPILSVDYSLAPEAPFPRAVEEVLFAYCWMRNNFNLIGTTGRKVIVAGDSAGGNLAAGLILQCIQLSLPKPDHLLAVYPSLLCQMYPSPSRLICLLDPLVMFPCLLRCLNSYADPDYVKTCPRSFLKELEYCQSYSDPLLSPLLASADLLANFPRTTLITSDIDPCLDETVSFSNKLIDAGVKVDLDVFSGLPHGFLSLSPASKDCKNAVDYISSKLRDVMLS